MHSTIIFLSDLHIGSFTDKFNPTVAQSRVLSIADNLPKEAPKRCVLAVAGDIIEGTDIHPRQNTMIHFSAREQADRAVVIFNTLIDKLQRLWPETIIEVRWVLGNHGRTSRTAHYDNNWDLVVGQRLKELHAKDLQTKWHVYTRQPHAIFKVNQTHFYMLHRTRAHLTHLETNAKKGVLFERLVHHKCDVMLMGHYHRGRHYSSQDGQLRLVVNGTLGECDPFYAEEYGYWSQPSQAVIHVPTKGKPTHEDVQWVRW